MISRTAISIRASARGWRRFLIAAAAIVLSVLICSDASSAYSVLTHEEIVDLFWAAEIRPLLLQTLSRTV